MLSIHNGSDSFVAAASRFPTLSLDLRGAEHKSHKVGSLGELSAFFFYATKVITTGEGGMVLTDDDECFSKLVDLRDYDTKALSPTKYNYKMTDLQPSPIAITRPQPTRHTARFHRTEETHRLLLQRYSIGF